MSLRNLINETRLLVDEFVAAALSGFDFHVESERRRPLELSELEERLLLSAAPMAMPAPDAVDMAELDPTAGNVEQSESQSNSASDEPPASETRFELDDAELVDVVDDLTESEASSRSLSG